MYIPHFPKKSLAVLLMASVSLSFCCFSVSAQTPPVLTFAPVVTTGFTSPLDIVNAKDGTNRLFIVERTGKVRIVSGGVLQSAAFLDVQDSLPGGGGSESGLLSMVFHPDYVNNGYLFIYYLNEDYDIRITRFRATTPTANTPVNQTTGVVIMTIPAVTASFHNGGKMNFGPDGNLYFAPGDGSPGGDPDNHAQNGNLLWGKMIRINVDNFTTPPYYTIPADNPYVNDPAIRDEIFSLGLRNAWRWSFDRLNHDMWVADVGETAWEEINYHTFATSGGINYGWRCYEGNADFNTTGCLPQSNYHFPIFVYPHNNITGGYSVIGGHVYRGSEYAALYGYYICADYVSGNAWLIKPNGSGGWTTSLQAGLPSSIVGFGEDENGILYAVTLTGTLYKVTTNSGGPLAVTLLEFNAKAFTGYNEVKWKTINEQDILHHEVEFNHDAVNYVNAGKLNALNILLENTYHFRHFITAFDRLFYRLKTTGKNGRVTYSTVVELNKKQTGFVKVFPRPVVGSELKFVTDKMVEEITLFCADGKQVLSRKMSNSSGAVTVPLPYLQKGVYLLRLKTKDEFVVEKIVIE